MNKQLYASLTNDQKALYMATGRVTVESHSLPVKDQHGKFIGIDTKYVAKCRGMVISHTLEDQYRFDTKAEALASGLSVHAEYVNQARAAGLL